jgi:hypothetical protein
VFETRIRLFKERFYGCAFHKNTIWAVQVARSSKANLVIALPALYFLDKSSQAALLLGCFVLHGLKGW